MVLGKEPVPVNEDVICLFPMTPLTRRLIHALKYRAIPGLAYYLIRHSSLGNKGEAFDCIREWGERPLFLPVPIHAARFRERGYNQTDKIASAMAMVCNGSVRKELVRNSFHGSQTALSVREREMNVAGVFRCKPRGTFSPAQLRIIVDDVYTTGATTASCAYALAGAGAEHIKTCALIYEKPFSARNDYVADLSTEWLE
jgi:predicted amidophosphoribosyltransferase